MCTGVCAIALSCHGHACLCVLQLLCTEPVPLLCKSLFEAAGLHLVWDNDGDATACRVLCAGFQDHGIYKGRQVAFYKRAQIFVADVWGAYGGQGLGSFRDIAELTMFADYLVPQILHDSGALTFSDELRMRIARTYMIPPGSEEETELRACSIQAIECLKAACNSKDDSIAQVRTSDVQTQLGWPPLVLDVLSLPRPIFGASFSHCSSAISAVQVSSIELDWWLWAQGISEQGDGPHHHRTLTIYY